MKKLDLKLLVEIVKQVSSFMTNSNKNAFVAIFEGLEKGDLFEFYSHADWYREKAAELLEKFVPDNKVAANALSRGKEGKEEVLSLPENKGRIMTKLRIA